MMYNNIAMLLICRLAMRCSQSKPPFSPTHIQSVLSYYKSGKSSIAISQQIIHPSEALLNLYPNYYIHHELVGELEKLEPGFCLKSMEGQQVGKVVLHKIFRLIVSAHIGKKDMGLDINTLKANPYLKRLVEMKENKKYVSKTSQILIEDAVQEKTGEDIQHILKSNILETQKLIQTGIGLPISFMICKKNINSAVFLKLLAKKRKSIHSDVIQCSAVDGKSEKKGVSLEETVYDHGFRLQNVFLRPYLHGCPTDLLKNNDSFNLEELLKVLNLIDFQGKLVLENTPSFAENVQFLDTCLKKVGYQKRKSGDIDLINEYMIF